MPVYYENEKELYKLEFEEMPVTRFLNDTKSTEKPISGNKKIINTRF